MLWIKSFFWACKECIISIEGFLKSSLFSKKYVIFYPNTFFLNSRWIYIFITEELGDQNLCPTCIHMIGLVHFQVIKCYILKSHGIHPVIAWAKVFLSPQLGSWISPLFSLSPYLFAQWILHLWIIALQSSSSSTIVHNWAGSSSKLFKCRI